jgi:hypothetical protein
MGMRYVLFICSEGEAFAATPEELDPTEWVDEMTRRGVRSFGDQLAPTDRATTVRLRDGDVVLSDGPFVETKEQILGFDVIECADLDEALEVAAKHPVARFGMIEVRPFWTPSPTPS